MQGIRSGRREWRRRGAWAGGMPAPRRLGGRGGRTERERPRRGPSARVGGRWWRPSCGIGDAGPAAPSPRGARRRGKEAGCRCSPRSGGRAVARAGGRARRPGGGGIRKSALANCHQLRQQLLVVTRRDRGARARGLVPAKHAAAGGTRWGAGVASSGWAGAFRGGRGGGGRAGHLTGRDFGGKDI